MPKYIRQLQTRVGILSLGAAAILGGLLLARLYPVWFSAWWLAVGMPAIAIGWKWRRMALLCAVLFGFAIGMQRGGAMQAELTHYQPWRDQKVVLTGHVRNDPVYDEKHHIDFNVDKVQIEGHKLPGQVRIRSPGGIGVHRGDIVEVKGKLFKGFGNYQAAISFAEIRIVSENNDPLEVLRRRFFSGVYNALPDPGASLGLGFLVGLRSGLPDDLQDQLRVLALSHIVVASGYNLTILVRMSRRVLAHSRFQAFAGSVALVLIMLMATGLSPSMARAGLVTLLSLMAWYYGRVIHPALILLIAAALTGWLNPLYIWSDLGWWLSFLAFAGVLLVAPLLTHRLYGNIHNKPPPLLAQIAIETMAAQLLVEPLIMLVFGQFSVLGLVANIMVAPLIPFAMLATFVAGVFGICWPEVAGWIGVPAHLLLGYILEVVRWLASFPWAAAPIVFSAPSLAAFYGALAAGGILIYRRSGYTYRSSKSVVE